MTGAPPAYHLRPRRGWLNDPNGVVHWRGRWHVFFQHNPRGPWHDSIVWGHASSADLVDWTEHLVAFSPVADGPDAGGCWSGVAVVDGDRVAVAYTGVRTSAVDTTICVRYASDDALDAWSAPVVAGLPPGGVREMRDPFVFTWEGRRWALLGAWLESGPGLLLWSCDDLDSWRFERVWLTSQDPLLGPLAPADIWECPQLVEVDGSWVLLVSLWAAGVLDRVVYAVGSLCTDVDGRPELVTTSGGLVDGGSSFYAPQVLQDAPGGGPLLFGWVREDGADAAASPEAVAGCLTLPRRLGLDGGRLVSCVDPAVRTLFGPIDAIPADGALPAQAYLRVGREDAQGVILAGVSLVIEVPVGAEAWLDGEVAEVYPVDGPPRTYRDPGTQMWTLSWAGDSTDSTDSTGSTGSTELTFSPTGLMLLSVSGAAEAPEPTNV
ncbi:glycoside hydrolase family 32 protein [Lapillicoccus sp.]|uniref:glycoside hydrolase family 32 protein n=1 Tax=Lapillicoccus sp. TaxID=1909287 RepID=UPI003265D99D